MGCVRSHDGHIWGDHPRRHLWRTTSGYVSTQNIIRAWTVAGCAYVHRLGSARRYEVVATEFPVDHNGFLSGGIYCARSFFQQALEDATLEHRAGCIIICQRHAVVVAKISESYDRINKITFLQRIYQE